MNCHCGIPAFFSEQNENGKKYDVFSCNLQPNGKKKVKCDFFIKEYIRDLNLEKIPKKQETFRDVEMQDGNIFYRQKLEHYMHLYEISENLPDKYRTAYKENINYILKKLNFDFFISESLESLRNRTKQECPPKKIHTSIFPIKITEYPVNLGVIRYRKTKRTTNKIKKTKIVTGDVSILLEKEEKEEKEENKESEVKEEEEKDSSDEEDIVNEEDNTFDVDEYNSGEDYNEDDGGAFSD